VKFKYDILLLNREKDIMSSTSETPMCEECGAVFVTIEELREHREAEQEDKKLRHMGLDDG
jgi:hypothetical protein